jgi:hypothetical protein
VTRVSGRTSASRSSSVVDQGRAGDQYDIGLGHDLRSLLGRAEERQLIGF